MSQAAQVAEMLFSFLPQAAPTNVTSECFAEVLGQVQEAGRASEEEKSAVDAKPDVPEEESDDAATVISVAAPVVQPMHLEISINEEAPQLAGTEGLGEVSLESQAKGDTETHFSKAEINSETMQEAEQGATAVEGREAREPEGVEFPERTGRERRASEAEIAKPGRATVAEAAEQFPEVQPEMAKLGSIPAYRESRVEKAQTPLSDGILKTPERGSTQAHGEMKRVENDAGAEKVDTSSGVEAPHAAARMAPSREPVRLVPASARSSARPEATLPKIHVADAQPPGSGDGNEDSAGGEVKKKMAAPLSSALSADEAQTPAPIAATIPHFMSGGAAAPGGGVVSQGAGYSDGMPRVAAAEKLIEAQIAPGGVHLLARVEKQEMRFDWNAPELGRIEVRTQVEHDRVGATVAVSDVRMRESLLADTGGLARALAEHSMQLETFQAFDGGQSGRGQGDDRPAPQAPMMNEWRPAMKEERAATVCEQRRQHEGALDLRA